MKKYRENKIKKDKDYGLENPNGFHHNYGFKF